MGQKISTSQSSSEISLSKKDSRNFKLKTKRCANWSRGKINVNVQENISNTFADTEKLSNDDDTQENANDEDGHNDDTVDMNSLAYPSIAELSNFTALSMMRNLEDVSLTNDKLTDDDFNEKCFNTINYEDTPMVQLVENTSLRRDSSTCTNEIKEMISDSLDGVEEKLTCKENVVYCREMEKSEEEEETLAAKLRQVERERDEAMSKLKVIEMRCEAYEEETKCLEANMESMEEKLRTILTELHSEVSKSKNLERQLSSTIQNAVDVTPLNEKLISQALHS